MHGLVRFCIGLTLSYLCVFYQYDVHNSIRSETRLNVFMYLSDSVTLYLKYIRRPHKPLNYRHIIDGYVSTRAGAIGIAPLISTWCERL